MNTSAQSDSSWPFEEPKNVAALTTIQVMRNGQPILFVSHDADDGAWQFHTDGNVSTDDVITVALWRIVDLDPSVKELANLPLDWLAIRQTPTEAWIRFRKQK